MAVVAGFAYPADFALAERDLRVFRAYRANLGTVVLVVRSPDNGRHCWEEAGVIVHYVPRRGIGLLGLLTFWVEATLSAWRAVRRHHVVMADASDLAGAFVVMILRWLTGVRMLLHLQYQFFEMSPLAFSFWKRWLFRVGARIACRFADTIRCVTEEIRQQALRAGVDPAKLIVIPSRTDPVLFDPTRILGRPVGQGRRLVYIGSMTKLKGLHILLAALPEILERFPEARLRLVGDGPARKMLEHQAMRAGLSGAVEFVGTIPYPMVPEVLESADVFVYPSLSEAMPRGVLEAMAMERPVVASHVGGIPEALRDGQEGLLVPPGDPSALAAAVCRLLGEPVLAQTLGARARQRILAHFSFERNMRALIDWHQTWAPPP